MPPHPQPPRLVRFQTPGRGAPTRALIVDAQPNGHLIKPVAQGQRPQLRLVSSDQDVEKNGRGCGKTQNADRIIDDKSRWFDWPRREFAA